MKKIVIYGATSAIALELGRCFAADGAALILVGRDAEKLQAVGADLTVHGACRIEVVTADLAQIETHQNLFERCQSLLGGVDVLVVAYGMLGSQERGQEAFAAAEEVIRTNFISVAAGLTSAANFFERQKSGQIVVITSVAGDRGRKSNYIYGAAKGGLAVLLQGLRNRLHRSGVNVLDARPGFVDTPMTRDFRKGPLFSSARDVGSAIYRGIQARKDVMYVPWFWRYIMLVIKLIPESIFKRLSI